LVNGLIPEPENGGSIFLRNIGKLTGLYGHISHIAEIEILKPRKRSVRTLRLGTGSKQKLAGTRQEKLPPRQPATLYSSKVKAKTRDKHNNGWTCWRFTSWEIVPQIFTE
jgi:hypothetical protein